MVPAAPDPALGNQLSTSLPWKDKRNAVPAALQNQPEVCWLQGQKQRLDELAQGPISTPPDGAPIASAPTPTDSTPAGTPPADSNAPYLLLFSLFVSSPSQWSATRHSLLLGCLRFALIQTQPSSAAAAASATHASSADGGHSWKEASDEELWRCASPMVRYFGAVHHLQEQLKGDSDADWDARLRTRCSPPTHMWALFVC